MSREELMYVRQQNVSKTESSVRIVFMLIVGNIHRVSKKHPLILLAIS